MSKKMLAILGGPHANGTTAAMLRHTVEAARAAGWQVDEVNLYQQPLAFCTGCRACLHTGACVQADGIGQITRLIQACDLVVLAAPVYWANVPAAVKNLFDRLLGVAMDETSTFPIGRLPGKRYIFLTACNTAFPFCWVFGQSRGAARVVDEFFKTAGMRCAGRFVCAGTGKHTELPQALKKRLEKAVR